MPFLLKQLFLLDSFFISHFYVSIYRTVDCCAGHLAVCRHAYKPHLSIVTLYCCIGFHFFLCPMLPIVRKRIAKKTKYSERYALTMVVMRDGALRKWRQHEARPGERVCICAEAYWKKFHPQFALCQTDLHIFLIESVCNICYSAHWRGGSGSFLLKIMLANNLVFLLPVLGMCASFVACITTHFRVCLAYKLAELLLCSLHAVPRW